MIILSTNTMLIVYIIFMAVILLLVSAIVIGKAFDRKKTNVKNADIPNQEKNISEKEKAAISMALHLYYGVHDHESDVITFKNVQSRYSPWSSKIYGIQ